MRCVEDTTSLTDPNCAKWIDGFCTDCSQGSYFNDIGECQQVDVLCKTFDKRDGSCKSCYSGFKLEGGKCVEDQDNDVKDKFCKKF